MPSASIIAALLTLGAFAVAGYSFYRAHRQSCQRADTTLTVLADILNVARPSKAEFAAMPAVERRRTVRFYSFADTRIAQARC